jgi:hypothetical protein
VNRTGAYGTVLYRYPAQRKENMSFAILTGMGINAVSGPADTRGTPVPVGGKFLTADSRRIDRAIYGGSKYL